MGNIHASMDISCNCHQSVSVEFKLIYYPDYNVFRIGQWNYINEKFDESPGVFSNPLSAYSKLKVIIASRVDIIELQNITYKDWNSDVPLDKVRDDDRLEERTRRDIYGNKLDDAQRKHTNDMIEEIRLGDRMGIVMPGSKQEDKQDAQNSREWDEYDPQAHWRHSPTPSQISEITHAFGQEVAAKWIDGQERYGNIFKGDTVEHAFMEVRDHMVYLWYIKEERDEARRIILSHEHYIDTLLTRIHQLERLHADSQRMLRLREEST